MRGAIEIRALILEATLRERDLRAENCPIADDVADGVAQQIQTLKSHLDDALRVSETN